MFRILALILLVLAFSPASAEEKIEVDVALVLAVDVSRSVNQRRYRAQLDGYIRAIPSPEVVRAIRSGNHGRIAVIYVQYSGAKEQAPMTNWVVIDSMASAQEYVALLSQTTRVYMGQTSISGVLRYSTQLFQVMPVRASRKVIDVSGDGVNNSSDVATFIQSPLSALYLAREYVLSKGITINGLAIEGEFSGPEEPSIDSYYREFVIGGPGAFLVYVKDAAVGSDGEAFSDFIRQKLVTEIASR